MQTLGKKEYKNEYFSPDKFDYIIIDEFHHKEEIYSSILTKSNINVFKDYLSFLKKINELDEAEKRGAFTRRLLLKEVITE